MATSRNPSFLKRQKEQQRAARATEKREQRRLRKQNKLTGTGTTDDSDIAWDAEAAHDGGEQGGADETSEAGDDSGPEPATKNPQSAE